MSDIAPDMRDRLGNIDQIRNILFGSELRDYDNRFKRLETEVANLQQETQKNLQQMKESLSAEMRAAVNSIEKKLQYLSAAADEEIADVRQQIDSNDRDISTTVAAIEQTFKSQVESLRGEMVHAHSGFQQDIKTFQTYILEELGKRYGNLSEVKVSRDDLAEMLFDLCMQLKGDRGEIPAEMEKEFKTNSEGNEYLLPDRQSS